MHGGVVEQSPDADEARGRDNDEREADKDEGRAAVAAERLRDSLSRRNWRAASPAAELKIVSTKRLNFSMTKPKAMTAMPVRTQAKKVRSFAAWSL